MKKAILFLFVLGVLSACSTTQTTSITTSADNEKAISLEQYLTLNNDYVKIPMTKMISGHLHLNATINGVQGAFILDTGAGATVIDTKSKDKFHLTTEQTNATGVGAGGQAGLQKSTNNTFKIGSLEKQAFALHLMNLDHINNAFQSMGIAEVDGVIGADILTSNKGIIDYAKLILYLTK